MSTDLRATSVVPAGHWSESAADAVVLDFDDRHRRRIVMTGVQGVSFLLDLPEAVMLRGGDGLRLSDGRLVEVVAAPEDLVEVRAKTPVELVRLAWHIGNRHLPAQITGPAIRLRRDHVIEDMLRGLGARMLPIEAPFDPEGGAYATAAAEAHAHGHHDHGHHDHGHEAHGHRAHSHEAHGHHEHGRHDHAQHEHESHAHDRHDHGRPAGSAPKPDHRHGDHAHSHEHHKHGHGHKHG